MTAPSAEVLYLWDGPKVRTSSALGQGRLYKGSFVYSVSPTGTQLESISHDEGRILAAEGASGTEFIDTWHIRDYLGSVRAIYDISTPANEVEDVSEHVLEQSDYYAFGGRIEVSGQAFDQENRYRYNGKEQLRFESLNLDPGLTDYGARYYAPTFGRWTSPDPLADKYYSISPYAFCNNNPVNYIDPDGKRQWPVNPTYKGESRKIGDGFRTPERPNHRGIDINIGVGSHDLGAPVIATHDGKIEKLRTISQDLDGGGNRIMITSEDDDVSTYYMHLDSFANVKEGDIVKEGTIIGYIGGSGKGIPNKYSPHLHYEVIVNGSHVNPIISGDILIDPQRLNMPIHLGTLDAAILQEQSTLNPFRAYILEQPVRSLDLQ